MTTEHSEPAPDGESEPTASAAGPGAFLVSVVSMAAVLVAAELFYRDSSVEQRLRKGTNYVTAKRLEYETLGGDIVVTGDSRMYHAINPQVMQETLQGVTGSTYTTFNFGIPSGTTPISPDGRARGRDPQAAAQGLHPRGHARALQLLRRDWRRGHAAGRALVGGAALREGRLAHERRGRGRASSTALRTSSGCAPSSARPSTHSTLAPAITIHNRGYWSLGGRIAPAQQDVRARGRAGAYAELMDKSKGIELRPTPGRYLAEAIDDLKRHGVKVIVMGTPQARQLDWYHDEKHTYFEYINEVKRITAEHGVPFVDMNAPPGIQSTDFMDGDHLSEPGTTIFTKYVATELVAPLLK